MKHTSLLLSAVVSSGALFLALVACDEESSTQTETTSNGGGGEASTTQGTGGATTANVGGDTPGTTDTSSSTTSGGGFDCATLPTKGFAADVEPILKQSCVSGFCHDASSPKGHLDLTTGAAFGHLVGVDTYGCSGDKVRVVPGDPDSSYLMQKVQGIELCGTTKRMPPPPKAKLSDEKLAIIAGWICAGAPDN